ncbi:MAG: GAF domain-containing protein [Rhizobiales bacterium]|nr:GAF domain-containing protein [Hyphomicrobiales bacterium]
MESALAGRERDAEAARLAAVRRYDILDTPPDGSFDRITAIAADLFSTPISIISLVDHDRIWFKSHQGLDVQQIGREPGLCASAIGQAEPWILSDAKCDVRSLANPLVAGDFGLQFYVGVPLRTHDGFNLGTLCVIDREPRAVTERQIEQLKHLASMVMDQMELRIAARRAIGDLSREIDHKETALRRAELMAKEIDHRVMNSLQIISGLLRLQSRSTGNAEASNELAHAANRVSAVAQVHRHIFMSESVEGAECRGYLQRLCEDLSRTLSPERSDVVVDSIEAELPIERIVALGLIVNELVTNAVKHGEGRITVFFGRSESGEYRLSVSDEGGGLPADFDAGAVRSLGMKVVASLVQQLDGKLIIGGPEDAQGTTFAVVFPGSDQPVQH